MLFRCFHHNNPFYPHNAGISHGVWKSHYVHCLDIRGTERSVISRSDSVLLACRAICGFASALNETKDI
jgi:hypothetical protein